MPALLSSCDTEKVNGMSRFLAPLVLIAYSKSSPLNGVQFTGILYLSPVFSTACKNGLPRATCSTLLMLTLGENSDVRSFLNAGLAGVVPGFAGSSGK